MIKHIGKGNSLKDEKLSKFDRVYEMIALLSERKEYMTARQIAELLSVSTRSVHRYADQIDSLLGVGMPLLERGPSGYRISTLNLVDVVMDHENLRSLSAIKATPLGALIKTRRLKVPDPLLHSLGSLIELKGRIHDDHFRSIFQALSDGKFLRIEYQSKDKIKEHHCVPIKLFFDYSLLYLTVFDEGYDHLIALGASKIKSVRPSNQRLSEEDMRHFREYVNSAWGKMLRHQSAKISRAIFKVDKSIIAYFRKNPMHQSQSIEELANGYYRISLDIHNPVEFVRFALRFGEHLTISGDESVLAETRGFLRQMLDQYS